jgi:CBS domain-containing protein
VVPSARTAHLDEEARQVLIEHILHRKGHAVETIAADAPVAEAIGKLHEHNIGALVVTAAADEGGEESGGEDGGSAPAPVAGILSERDIVRAAAKDEAVFPRLVSQLMTRDLVLGSPGDDLTAVGHTMVQRRIRHLPVVDGGQLVGMISIGDVVKAQRDQYQGEVDTLQTLVMEQGH